MQDLRDNAVLPELRVGACQVKYVFSFLFAHPKVLLPRANDRLRHVRLLDILDLFIRELNVNTGFNNIVIRFESET